MPKVSRLGNCPYCGGRNFDMDCDRENPQQKAKHCASCDGWSVTLLRTGSQYPLQNKGDRESTATVSIP